MPRWLYVVVSTLLLIGGGYFIYTGFFQEPIRTPDLAQSWTTSPDQKPVGPTSAPTVPAGVPEDGSNPSPEGMMSPAEMNNNTLFIPSIGAYGPLDQSGSNGKIENGVLTLPGPTRIVRWRDGAEPGASKGTVLITGHISFNGVQGVLHNLALAKAGAIAFVKDDKGKVYQYQLTGMDSIKKASLPQEIWDTKGVPRLVVVTCGGKLVKNMGAWHYENNIVSYWKPISTPTTKSN